MRAPTVPPVTELATEHGERVWTFTPAFQPLCTVRGRWFGAETLARWESHGAVIGPAVAFAAGMDPARASLAALMAGTRAYASRGGQGVLALNVPPSQVAPLADRVARIAPELRRRGVKLMLELTEDEEMTHREVLRGVEHLRRFGVAIAVDDIGTGTADFAAIDAVKPDVAKIPMAAWGTSGTDIDAGSRAVRALAVAFPRMLIIVEGIASEAHMSAAVRAGGHILQGAFVGMPQRELPSWMFSSIEPVGAVADRLARIMTLPAADLHLRRMPR